MLEFVNDLQKEEKIVVYGAGFIANVVYKVMKQYGLHNKIQAFIVCNCEENPSEIDGISVQKYTDYIDGNEKLFWEYLMINKLKYACN